jgi:hypothetical protein
VRKCLFVTWLGFITWIRRLFSGLSPLRPGHFGFEVNTVACVQILLCHMDAEKEVKWIPNRSSFLIRQLMIAKDSWKKIVVFALVDTTALRTLTTLLTRSQNWEKRVLASSCLSVGPPVCLSVRPSVREEQFASKWKDFYEIPHFNMFRKSVKESKFSLKSGKNNGHFTWRPVYSFDHNFPQLFLEWETFQIKVV